ncbi:MAG: M42 family peptidase [Anaerolineaceae bacterium]|nr:MAG: M42 family peptidase [Anaerolineaceae bacterium]
MKQLLQTLTQIPAPSGREDEIRAAIQKMIQPYADEIRVDALGNLIARKGKKAKDGRRILLAAHMDEIGLMVSHVDTDGFARFSTLGGFRPHRRVGTRIRFLNGVMGVIGLEREAEEKDRAPSLDRYFIDTGANSAKDSPVKVGDAAVYDSLFLDLGDRVVSKCLDDRVGVALLIESLTRLKSGKNEVWYVFTVQEEVGARGAGPASYGIDPEIGLAVDVTVANNMPNTRGRNPISLGGGPAIKVKDAGVVADPRIVQAMTRLAEKNRIPHQFEVIESIGTDARAMQVTGLGAQTGGLAIPLRNLHSPSEMIDMGDVKNAARLLAAFLREA